MGPIVEAHGVAVGAPPVDLGDAGVSDAEGLPTRRASAVQRA